MLLSQPGFWKDSSSQDVPSACPGHSSNHSLGLWSPLRPLKWSRLPGCLIPFRQTLGNCRLQCINLFLAPHAMSMAGVPFRRVEGRTSRRGARPQLSQGSCWPWITNFSLQPRGGATAGLPLATLCSSQGQSELQTDSVTQILSQKKIETIVRTRLLCSSLRNARSKSPKWFLFLINSEGSLC